MLKLLKKMCINFIKAIAKAKYMWLADVFLILCSYTSVQMVVFSVRKMNIIMERSASYIILSICVYLVFLILFGCYKVIWKHSSMKDLKKVVYACLCSGVVMTLVSWLLKITYFYVKSSIMASFITLLCLSAYRIFVKYSGILLSEHFSLGTGRRKINVLVVGAGSAGAVYAENINSNKDTKYNIVAFVDDYKKINSQICGVKIKGRRNDIPKLCKDLRVDEIIIATPSLSIVEKQKIINVCTQTSCDVKIMPSIKNMATDGSTPIIRPVHIEDLLEREPIYLDDLGIVEIIGGKTVMVTGGGGSIGSELCRQLVKHKPKTLIILDIYENNAYDLQNELLSDYPNQDLKVLIASVRDERALEVIFEKHRPEIVYHAAAHKHVPLMEHSPSEAIKNNVFGTYNVAKCADKFGAEKFVMISTDKAVNPTNVMGATKRMCEMIVQSMQKVSNTQFVAVRFGNVLGSNGSVIPLFKKQIEKGGPITITHKEITRFFMTIPEAAQLVIQASCFALGGEIFVLDMGQPVKIYDLAKNLIRLSGYTPDKDIKIEVTGLRPGEKLYEELLMSEEGLKTTGHSKIFVGQPMDISHEEIIEKLNSLKAAMETHDDINIRKALAEAVPTYERDINFEKTVVGAGV